MIRNDERYRLKLKAAYYYYEKNMTQMAISKMLGISRPTLSKLLKECREDGIVEIKIHDLQKQRHLVDLEIAIKDKFKLKDVRVVDCGGNNPADLHDSLGEAAASYLQRILASKMKVGLSWGKTLKAAMDHLKEDKSVRDLEVVTLIGGSGGMDSQIHANILCEKFLGNYHGKGYFLYVPTIVDSPSLLNLLMSNTETGNILDRARKVDIAVVGIGPAVESSTVLETGYFGADLISELKRAGAVGDICSRFFDERGNICDLSINDRIFGITLQDLKKIKNVIGVAGGKEKVAAILGALRGRFINMLVTDEVSAKGILI